MGDPSFHRALITGASSGLGAAFSRFLAVRHVELFLAGRDRSALVSVADEALLLGAKSVALFPGDLSKEEEVRALVALLEEQSPDLVINNAGMGLYGPVVEQEVDRLVQMIDLNVKALAVLSREAARRMVQGGEGGCILNIASAAAFVPFPLSAMYSATKAFVHQFSSSMDFETAPHGVRVLAACPGVIATRFRERAGGFFDVEKKSVMSAEYAVEQLWWQMKRGKQIHIFGRWTRWMTLFAHYLLPRALIASILKRQIMNLHR